MKDAFIVHGKNYHIADGVWTPNILQATNYGIGDEAHIMNRVRTAFVKERIWAQGHISLFTVHIGIVNVANGGFIVEAIKGIES